MKLLRNSFLLLLILISSFGCNTKETWELVWADEFDYTGAPLAESWGYETGYERNNELQ